LLVPYSPGVVSHVSSIAARVSFMVLVGTRDVSTYLFQITAGALTSIPLIEDGLGFISMKERLRLVVRSFQYIQPRGAQRLSVGTPSGSEIRSAEIPLPGSGRLVLLTSF